MSLQCAQAMCNYVPAMCPGEFKMLTPSKNYTSGCPASASHRLKEKARPSPAIVST